MNKRVLKYYNLEYENGIDMECEEYRRKGLLGPWVFRNLPEKIEFTVRAKQHDIHYKEQIWNMPNRDIVYCMELVRSVSENLSITNRTHSTNTEMYRELAREGVIRYYKIITNENVTSCIKSLGYVSVYSKDNGFEAGSIKYMLYIDSNNLKRGHLDEESVTKLIKSNIRKHIVEI